MPSVNDPLVLEIKNHVRQDEYGLLQCIHSESCELCCLFISSVASYNKEKIDLAVDQAFRRRNASNMPPSTQGPISGHFQGPISEPFEGLGGQIARNIRFKKGLK